MQVTFNRAYTTSRWTDAGNRSGPGSEPDACKPMWESLAAFIAASDIRSIVDVSCGGMAWWPHVLTPLSDRVSFHGFDVSQTAIAAHEESFCEHRNWRFGVADARTFSYPTADLIVCRQTLNHLYSPDALAVVSNITKQARRFVAFTSDDLLLDNPSDAVRVPLMPQTKDATCYTRLNLNAKPFNLAPAVEIIPDVDGDTLSIFLSEIRPVESCCIISAFIGDRLDRLRQSPLAKEQSFFWGNKEDFRHIVEAAGWTFFLDSEFSGDPKNETETSIRSKHFKFLAFLGGVNTSQVVAFRYALWADAKRIPISLDDFQAFLEVQDPSSHIVPGIKIRTTPTIKETIESEIEAALGQERYAGTMDRVRAVIDREFSRSFANNSVRICNTGLILYDLANPEVRELNAMIYDATIETANPECQIFFSLFRQRFRSSLVEVVPYEKYPSHIE